MEPDGIEQTRIYSKDCRPCTLSFQASEAEISRETLKMITRLNKRSQYIGLLVQSISETQPLLHSSSYKRGERFTHIDCAGRRFHIGSIEKKNVIMAMTGKGMLVSFTSILHYGLAGNADENQNVGDMVVPQFWAHTGLWNWQRYGDGPDDELSLEEDGDFTRDYGNLNFADFTNKTDDEDSADNFLNSIWYQAEEIFHADADPESKDTACWVPISHIFFQLAKKMEGMKLEERLNTTTCLPKAPQLMTVKRGSSANIYLDNDAYKSFLHSKFQVSPVDMESAAIALISHQQKVPFIAFRALTDLAGERSTQSNEGYLFSSLHVNNLIRVLVHFIKNMEEDCNISSM